MPRVLVTGAHGHIGNAIGRILAESLNDVELHGGDSCGEWPGKSVFQQMHVLPDPNSPVYAEGLGKLAGSIGADLIIPTLEPELLRLSASPLAGDASVMMNQPALVDLFLNKLLTFDWLKDRDLPTPETFRLEQAKPSHLPVFVKTIYGSGNKNYHIVESEDRLRLFQAELGSGWIAQDYLDSADEEYTCALIGLAGQQRHIAMKRKLYGGSTVEVEVSDNRVIRGVLEEFSEHLDGDYWLNIQLQLTDNGPMIFEINPRFSGTTMMRHLLGFQDFLWFINHKLGRLDAPPAFAPAPGRRVYRMLREIVGPSDPAS